MEDRSRYADLVSTSGKHQTRLPDAGVIGRSRMPLRAGRLQPTLAAVVTTVALAACGSIEETMIERGHPPAYAEGYADGCASGKAAAGGLFAEARKEASRYGADDQYTEGWDEGFQQCRADMAAMVLDARLRNPSRDN